MTKQILAKGERVIGTVCNAKKIKGLMEKYPHRANYFKLIAI
jgi:hypothetical protein